MAISNGTAVQTTTAVTLIHRYRLCQKMIAATEP
jgi:hypothetical protein